MKTKLNKEKIGKYNSLYHFNDPVVFVPKTLLYVDKKGNKNGVSTLTKKGNLTARNRKKSIKLKEGGDFEFNTTSKINVKGNTYNTRRTTTGLLTAIKSVYDDKLIRKDREEKEFNKNLLSNYPNQTSRKGRRNRR